MTPIPGARDRTAGHVSMVVAVRCLPTGVVMAACGVSMNQGDTPCCVFFLFLLAAIARAVAAHESSEALEQIAGRFDVGISKLIVLVLTVVLIELLLKIAGLLWRRRKGSIRKH
jgi:high-affinity nickel permease